VLLIKNKVALIKNIIKLILLLIFLNFII